MNDFDEVYPGPWEWDLKRLVASFVIAGQSNGFDPADRREAGWLAAQAYRQRMAEYAEMPALQVWNDVFDLETVIENIPDKENKRFYSRKLSKATEESAHEKEFAKLTFTAGDTPRIMDQPPLIYHYDGVQDQEFIVVYETDDLPRFSDLVNELRSTDGRRYTLRDTPLHTALYHPAEETLALWR